MTSYQNKSGIMADSPVNIASFLRPLLGEIEALEIQRRVREREERLKNVLSSIEPAIMKIQSILVWENPMHSASMLLGVNLIFWLLTATSYRFFFLVSMSVLTILLIDTWKNKIWPEIRVPPPDGEDTESWTPVHPQLMGVPELSHHLAEIWVTMAIYNHMFWNLRKIYPGKFCLLVCGCCISTAFVGHYIPGIMISYIMVMSVLLWPCVVYHNVLQKFYIKFEPLMMRMEYKLKIRRRKTRKDPSKKKSVDSSRNRVETDSESDFGDFTPSADPEVTAALARAITDSEDENSSPSVLTPRLSREPSIASDAEDADHDITVHESSLYSGLQHMPSFDDHTLDDPDSLHLSLSQPEGSTVENVGSGTSMQFVSSHFDHDISDSEVGESLLHGLAFPDVHPDLSQDSLQEADETVLNEPAAPSSDINIKQESENEQTNPETATEMVSRTLTNVATSTWAGFGRLGESVMAATGYSGTKNETEAKPKSSTGLTRDSSGSDLADFEFLDEEDLDNYSDNENKN